MLYLRMQSKVSCWLERLPSLSFRWSRQDRRREQLSALMNSNLLAIDYFYYCPSCLHSFINRLWHPLVSALILHILISIWSMGIEGKQKKNHFISVNYGYKWDFYCLNWDFTFPPVKEQWLCNYNNEGLNRRRKKKQNYSQSFFLSCSFERHHAFSLCISLAVLMTESNTQILHVLVVMFTMFRSSWLKVSKNIHLTCSETERFSALEQSHVVFNIAYRCHCCHMCRKDSVMSEQHRCDIRKCGRWNIHPDSYWLCCPWMVLLIRVTVTVPTYIISFYRRCDTRGRKRD